MPTRHFTQVWDDSCGYCTCTTLSSIPPDGSHGAELKPPSSMGEMDTDGDLNTDFCTCFAVFRNTDHRVGAGAGRKAALRCKARLISTAFVHANTSGNI